MKIIQTLWLNEENLDIATHPLSIRGGWLDKQFNWMSWALSCLQLKKYYHNIELITNSLGKQVLIDELKLPYTSVFTHLDNEKFKNMPKELWTMAKVYSYGIQNEPFLHVDGDVFIWDKFDEVKIQSEIFTQNFEIDLQSYYDTINNFKNVFTYIPPEILKFEKGSNNPITVCNTGVAGGKNYQFFKEYSTLAFDFLEKNKTQLPKVLSDKYFGVFVEQYFIYSLARKHSIKISTLLNPIQNNFDFKILLDIYNVPANANFVHPIGHFKANEKLCNFVDRKLRLFHTEYYYSMLKVFKKHDLSIHSSVYSTASLNTDIFSSEEFIALEKVANDNPSALLNKNTNTIIVNEYNSAFNSFYRTNFVLKKFECSNDELIKSEPNGKKIKDKFQQAIKKVNSIEHKTICNDIFNYELARLEFVQNVKNDTYEYGLSWATKAASERILDKATNTELIKQSFEISKTSKAIKTKWDYSANLENSWEESYKDIFTTKEEDIYTIFILNILALKVDEVRLKDMQRDVYLSFSNTRKVSDVYFKVLKIVGDRLSEDVFDKSFFDTIRFLVYRGILVEGNNAYSKSKFQKFLGF